MTARTADAERAAAAFLMIGFEGLDLTEGPRTLLRRGAFGAILFARNFADREQVAGLCAAIKAVAPDRPVAVAVDQEGGRVLRFRGPGFTEIPAMRDVGLHGGPERARAVGALLASELRPLGIDIDFAPVLDVDSNPANPVIGERSFHRTPERVAACGVALIEGLQSGGVAACGKHFPGHGDTDLDSHHHLPRLAHDLARLRAIELVPFRAAIATGVAAVMSSHILFPALDADRPATMSPAALGGILRRELGFTGTVFSDDLEMKAIAEHYPMPGAAVDAARAGCDVLLACHTAELQEAIVAALAKAIVDGTLPAARVAEAEARRKTLVARFVR
jgi:beta-N-acetylhexosaminidase